MSGCCHQALSSVTADIWFCHLGLLTFGVVIWTADIWCCPLGLLTFSVVIYCCNLELVLSSSVFIWDCWHLVLSSGTADIWCCHLVLVSGTADIWCCHLDLLTSDVVIWCCLLGVVISNDFLWKKNNFIKKRPPICSTVRTEDSGNVRLESGNTGVQTLWVILIHKKTVTCVHWLKSRMTLLLPKFISFFTRMVQKNLKKNIPLLAYFLTD
jgi:hypothetical protein